jgi:hypothetical protein
MLWIYFPYGMLESKLWTSIRISNSFDLMHIQFETVNYRWIWGKLLDSSSYTQGKKGRRVCQHFFWFEFYMLHVNCWTVFSYIKLILYLNEFVESISLCSYFYENLYSIYIIIFVFVVYFFCYIIIFVHSW